MSSARYWRWRASVLGPGIAEEHDSAAEPERHVRDRQPLFVALDRLEAERLDDPVSGGAHVLVRQHRNDALVVTAPPPAPASRPRPPLRPHPPRRPRAPRDGP